MAKEPTVVYFDVDCLDQPTYEAAVDMAKEIVKAMKSDAKIPDDTGLYKSSLSTKQDKKNREALVFEDAKKKGRRVIGHFLENGTPHTDAQPHWNKYIEEYTPKFQEKLTDVINKTL